MLMKTWQSVKKGYLRHMCWIPMLLCMGRNGKHKCFISWWWLISRPHTAVLLLSACCHIKLLHCLCLIRTLEDLNVLLPVKVLPTLQTIRQTLAWLYYLDEDFLIVGTKLNVHLCVFCMDNDLRSKLWIHFCYCLISFLKNIFQL